MIKDILLRIDKNLTTKKSCQEIKNLTCQFTCQELPYLALNIKSDMSENDITKNLTDNTPPLGGCLSGFLSGLLSGNGICMKCMAKAIKNGEVAHIIKKYRSEK